MAIFSQSSDLATKQIVWTPRKTDSAAQSTFAGQVSAHEAWFFAACYRDKYGDDALAKLPHFD